MSNPKPVDHLQVAKNNLQIPSNITPEQYKIRVAVAQASATVTLAEQQARTTDALELANLIAYLKLAKDDQLPEATPGNIRRIIQRNIEVGLGLA
jgi:hypothetical protein